jgi:hypothetical protein
MRRGYGGGILFISPILWSAGMRIPQLLTDVVPWPSGTGFRDAQQWWDYVLVQDERSRIDHLLGLAFLNPSIGTRLLRHDETLFAAFRLSQGNCNAMKRIRANSVEAFAQALLDMDLPD